MREEALEVKNQLDELLGDGKIKESRSPTTVGSAKRKSELDIKWSMDMQPLNKQR